MLAQIQRLHGTLHTCTCTRCETDVQANHTNECNTITSEVVSMITTFSDLFRSNELLIEFCADNLVKTLNEHTALV